MTDSLKDRKPIAPLWLIYACSLFSIIMGIIFNQLLILSLGFIILILCSEIRGIERSIEILKMLSETQKRIIKTTEYIDLVNKKVDAKGKNNG